MGSAYGTPTTYSMNGKQHGDSVVYKDEDLLATTAGGKLPEYITSL